MTLEKYLKEYHGKGIVDHAIRFHVHIDGLVSFYIHPLNADGETLDFVVCENQLFAAQFEQPDGTTLVKHGEPGQLICKKCSTMQKGEVDAND